MSTLGSDNNPGTGSAPNLAFFSIQHAFDNLALQPNDYIIVLADGIYKENLTWPQMDGIKLVGYDPNDPSAKAWIDGENNDRVITMTPGQGVQYTNFTILQNLSLWNGTAPTSSNGGGIYMVGDVAPVLDNMDINLCSASSGGGIFYQPIRQYIDFGNCWQWKSTQACIINNVYISGCEATDDYGGGIFVGSSQYSSANDDCPEIDVYDYTIDATNLQLYRNNATNDGGGMYLSGANIRWQEGWAYSNTCERNGGGMFSFISKTTLFKVDLWGNHAEKGGAAYFERGLKFNPVGCNDCIGTWDGIENNWMIVKCVNNTAEFVTLAPQGGALYFDGLSLPTENFIDLVFVDGEITDNYTAGSGGGIFVLQGTTLHLKNINIARNTSDGSGGGICNNSWWHDTYPATGYHHFEQLLITDNEAGGLGGAIFTVQAFSCINSTIANNSAANNGGALACNPLYNGSNEEDNNPAFFNCIFWEDKVNGNPNEVYLMGDLCDPQFNHCDIQYLNTWAPPMPMFNFTIITHNPPFTWDDQGWSCSMLPTNIDLDPLFADPANFDYSISSNSNCKDVGYDNLCTPNDFPGFGSWFGYRWDYDFAGNTRKLFTHIDIGAYESLAKSCSFSSNPSNNNKRPEILIYPNPIFSGNDLTINYPSNSIRLLQIEILNSLGQVVFYTSLNQSNDDNYLFPWPNSVDHQGLYLINVKYINDENKILTYNSKICLTQ